MLDASSGSQNKYVNFRIGVSNSEQNSFNIPPNIEHASLPNISKSILKGANARKFIVNARYRTDKLTQVKRTL